MYDYDVVVRSYQLFVFMINYVILRFEAEANNDLPGRRCFVKLKSTAWALALRDKYRPRVGDRATYS